MTKRIQKSSQLTKLTEQIGKQLNKMNVTPGEAQIILKNMKKANPRKYGVYNVDFPDKHIRLTAFSDAHMGHMNYRPDILDKMVKDSKRFKSEFYVNSGDTIEGMSGRDGHIYELDKIGATAQLDYFAEEFQKFNKPVLSIEADSSHGGWFKSKGNAGLDIGPELARRDKKYEFLGYDEQQIKCDNGLTIGLRHPGGGTAYAISYKMQKYIESISGGKKPNVVLQGHFHKANYMFYRNVHCFDAGCLQEQSPFMRKVGTPAHLGYWLLDINMHKQKSKGVERIAMNFVPFYE